ncbi:MAG: hypothetical protein O3A01_07375 [bacterium]|nr:hypothetical protein [bacterium]
MPLRWQEDTQSNPFYVGNTACASFQEAESIAEARAFAGPNYNHPINHGDVVHVYSAERPGFFQKNGIKSSRPQRLS